MPHNPMKRNHLFERYRAHRISAWLRRGRTRYRRRVIVCALGVTFAAMCVICVLCAMGIGWAPPLWLVVCAVGLPLVRGVTILSGTRDQAPTHPLEERETTRRDAARSRALGLTGSLLLVPILYLLVGAVLTGGKDQNMSYAGGCMVLTALVIGGFAPEMQLTWDVSDAEEADSA